MTTPITAFADEYRFLSNFHSAPVTFDGITFPDVECAFQAQKEPEMAHLFTRLTPAQAKRNGRRARLRDDWDDVKDDIMYELVRLKFKHHLSLRAKLLATGQRELIEGNAWDDTYWGVCKGVGENRLGHILMRVRDEFREL